MVEKDIGKIPKREDTDIVVRIDDFAGFPGVTIREFVTSEKYTGFTKQGTKIPADKFVEFREMINSINLEDLKSVSGGAENKEEKVEVSEEKKVEVEEF